MRAGFAHLDTDSQVMPAFGSACVFYLVLVVCEPIDRLADIFIPVQGSSALEAPAAATHPCVAESSPSRTIGIESRSQQDASAGFSLQ
jgi:hypothetical protein